MSVLMWIAGAAALGAGAIGWMRAEARGYRVREEEVVSERIPHSFDGFRILFITDIHRRQLSEEKLLSNLSSVDCVLLGGDITERGVPLQRLRHNMSVLVRIAPVYAVLGNHDLNAGKDAVRKALRESGVMLLNDKTVTLQRSNELIVLSGVRQPASRKHPYTRFRGMQPKTSITSFWCMIRYGSRTRMWCMGIWCLQDIPMGDRSCCRWPEPFV